jgi:hypothetical protein
MATPDRRKCTALKANLPIETVQSRLAMSRQLQSLCIPISFVGHWAFAVDRQHASKSYGLGE